MSVAVIVVLLAGVALLVVQRGQASTTDALLKTAISRADDVNDPPAGMWLVMWTPSGRGATPGMPAGLPVTTALREVADGGPTRVADVHLDGHEYRVRTEQRGQTTIQAIRDLRADHLERDRLLSALLISGGFGLALAALLGAWLGHRALAPLSAALALQRRFVADASHELRTPLTLLSTRAQLVRRALYQDTDPQLVRHDVDGLVDDAAALAEILEDLLLAADPRTDPQLERVDLVGLVKRCLAASAPAAQEHGVRLTDEHSDGEVPVLGAAPALRRALTALVDNAVRHARHTVTIVLRTDDEHAVLEVRDDGTGIEPEIVPRLFERFASTRRAGGGRRRYGLGLALVSEIAARHGGCVHARNDPAGGAVIGMTLPLAPLGTRPDQG